MEKIILDRKFIASRTREFNIFFWYSIEIKLNFVFDINCIEKINFLKHDK